MPALEICRRLGSAETTFCRWRKKHHRVSPVGLRELELVRDEIRKLAQPAAELSLDGSRRRCAPRARRSAAP